MKLFEKFGEFSSAEEINTKAQELKEAGKEKAVRELAKENGIDEEIAEYFIDGYVPLLCDATIAACGKLDAEVVALSQNNAEIGEGVADYLKTKANEDEVLAKAIRAKGKSLEEFCKKAWKEAEQRRKGYCAYIPPFEMYQMAKAYYLEEVKEK